MVDVSKDKIITMTKGDTLRLPISIMIKSYDSLTTDEYFLGDSDTLHFRIMNCSDDWEDAIIKKAYRIEDTDQHGRVVIKLSSSETSNLKSGKYFYEVKFLHEKLDGSEVVDTIISRREFVLLD